MDYRAKLKQNIWKNYVFTFLTNFNLTEGIWMIYLASIKGMSLYQVGILEAVFHITGFLMEIPTGAIADIWGKKVSRTLGRVMSVVCRMVMIISNSFPMFVVAFVFTGLSYNLESGAGQALIYDSLKELGEEDKFMKITGRQEVVFQVASICGLLLGGYVATISHMHAYIVAAVIGVVAIIQSLTFTEPNIETKRDTKLNFVSSIKEQITGSAKVLKSSKKLGFYILFLESLLTLITCITFYLQNYLKGTGYIEFSICMVFAAAAFVGAIVSAQAHRIEKTLTEKGILFSMPVIAAFCLWGIALTPYPYIFYVVLMGVEGIVWVVINDYINKLIPSEKRATLLSVCAMVFSAFMIVIFPLVGKLGDVFSLPVAFTVLAVCGTLLAFVNLGATARFTTQKEDVVTDVETVAGH